MILGDSLLENNQLKFLDLSKNRLGDMGIRNILYPLLIRGLCETSQCGLGCSGDEAVRYNMAPYYTIQEKI
jgi:hypothetical protein